MHFPITSLQENMSKISSSISSADLGVTHQNTLSSSGTQVVELMLPMFNVQKGLLFFPKLILLFLHAVFIVLHMPLPAKELLTNHHDIHFLSIQLVLGLASSVSQHFFFLSICS